MYRIKHLPHTADIRIEIEADHLENLFLAGLIAMNQILAPKICSDGTAEHLLHHQISIHSVDTTALLIDFLSELLTIAQTENAIYCELKLVLLKENYLMAELWGQSAPCFEEDIKAVTYHEADVKRTDSGFWHTYIVFDI